MFAAGRRSYKVVAFAGLVLEPRLGAKLWGCVRDCGIAAIVRGGAPLLRGAVAFAGLVWEPRLGAKLLGMGSVLLDGRHSPRGAAPTRAM
ncbi:hypothetical protein JF55_02950 [Pseudomonas sp. 1-7]|nr:hypothetical protein JF55_02950 [Pseudomonas sp. 1-7]